jgi:hypothetical protein
VAVAKVPDNMDLWEFFDYFKRVTPLILSTRVVKTEFTKFYAIIFQFKTTRDADDFIEEFQGRRFNLIDESRIILKKIEKVLSEHHLERGGGQEMDEGMREDKQVVRAVYQTVEGAPESIFSLTEQLKTFEEHKSGVEQKEREMLSFKECPICLEPLSCEETTIIILCSHKFHLKCLLEWTDETCPVCRYQQYPFELSFCEKCDVCNDLWCCIICGFVGCGGTVPIHGHINDHYNETSHIYSKPIIKVSEPVIQEIGGSRKGIWDHSRHDFIHSLIYNSGSNTIMEGGKEDKEKRTDKKMEEMNDEINQLVSTQLDSQRSFYEDQLLKLEMEFEEIREDHIKITSHFKKEIEVLEEEKGNLDCVLKEHLSEEAESMVESGNERRC